VAEKESSRFKATPTYPRGESKPRMEILRDNISMVKPTFEMEDISDERARKKAEEYAAELQRETRGKAKGGKVSASSRADGIAQRGKTRGKMY
jgi:hypothetical protein